MSSSRAYIPCFLALVVCLPALPAAAQDESPFTCLFDTGAPSAEPLAAAALAARTGWRLVPEDTIAHEFAGDAVVVNDKLALVMRKKGGGAEVYARAEGGLQPRAAIGHAGGRATARNALVAFKIVENASGAVMLEAAFGSDAPAALCFRMTAGEAILEIRPGRGSGFLDVSAKTRHVVAPDYFGDDLVFGADAFRGRCLPAENFCLNLIEGGDAIVMSVWQSSEQDVWLAEPSAGDDFRSSRIRCLADKRIWLAFLESPGIWQAAPGTVKDGRRAPFPAKWRCSLVRDDCSADSWDMEKGPAPEQAAGAHRGPLVVYPIDRSRDTPLTIACPTDVMRNTLGVGPCQYILEVEGLAADGDCTPASVMDRVEKQFERKKAGAAAGEIAERLAKMVEHVAHARARIERYGQLAGEIRKALAGAQGQDRFVSIAGDLERFVASGLRAEASPARAGQLSREVSALAGKDNALAECRRIGEELRSIGVIQDGALARARTAVRCLRQQALEVGDGRPQDALARELRRLAERMLKKE